MTILLLQIPHYSVMIFNGEYCIPKTVINLPNATLFFVITIFIFLIF